MLVLVRLDDSDEVFKELDELIMNVDLDECKDEQKVGEEKELVEEGKEKDMDEEIRELLGKEIGTGIECLGIDIDKITFDILEDFLNVVDNPDPNEKIDQGQRNNQASIKELEQRLESMNEWVENPPTGQITSYIQSNPRLSNNQDAQGLRYQTPYQNDNNVNVTGTRAGFNHGDEEEQNGNENETGAELGPIASQPLRALRRNPCSGCCFLFVAQSVASQSVPLRSNDPVQPINDPKVELEVGNQVGNDPTLQSKVKELKMDANTPRIAYKPRIPKKEDELEKEMERKPPEWSEVHGMQDFIDQLIVYLCCRKDDGIGKVGEANFQDWKRKCVCMDVGDVRMVVVILVNTKEWNDAMMTTFEKYLVSMETCDFYNICLCFIFDTMK